MPDHIVKSGTGYPAASDLGSGTPTGAKYLRDDGVWTVPPTGEGGSLPAGCIIMWHGTLANIPSGFALCDGNNGTPDLRSKFVKGAAAGVDPGATGGAATHTHDDHASHTHTYTEVINHTHPVTDPGHSHIERRFPTTTGSSSGFTADTSMSGTPTDVTQATKVATTGITTTNPAGGVATGTTNGPSATLTHSSPNHEPPYYAVAFIMKT